MSKHQQFTTHRSICTLANWQMDNTEIRKGQIPIRNRNQTAGNRMMEDMKLSPAGDKAAFLRRILVLRKKVNLNILRFILTHARYQEQRYIWD